MNFAILGVRSRQPRVASSPGVGTTRATYPAHSDRSARCLAPDNWTHPDPGGLEQFRLRVGREATVTRTANGDDDAQDSGAVVDIWVERLAYERYQPCRQGTQAEREQCEQDCEDDRDGSPFLKLTGPSVAVTIGDNDQRLRRSRFGHGAKWPLGGGSRCCAASGHVSDSPSDRSGRLLQSTVAVIVTGIGGVDNLGRSNEHSRSPGTATQPMLLFRMRGLEAPAGSLGERGALRALASARWVPLSIVGGRCYH